MRTAKLRPWIRRLKRWRAERWFAAASVVIAACSMIIAIFSAGLSAYSAYLMREQARLSVRPKLIVTFMFNDTGAGWTSANEGLGPARLRGIRAKINGGRQAPPLLCWQIFADA